MVKIEMWFEGEVYAVKTADDGGDQSQKLTLSHWLNRNGRLCATSPALLAHYTTAGVLSHL